MYNTSAKRKRQGGEINNGPVLVETAGYISRERKIKTMIAAGARLEMLRRLGYFDVTNGSEDIEKMPLDPTREKSFHFADAHEILRDIENRVAQCRANMKKTEDDLNEALKKNIVSKNEEKNVDEISTSDKKKDPETI